MPWQPMDTMPETRKAWAVPVLLTDGGGAIHLCEWGCRHLGACRCAMGYPSDCLAWIPIEACSIREKYGEFVPVTPKAWFNIDPVPDEFQ